METDYTSAYQQFAAGQSPDKVRSTIAHSTAAGNAIKALYPQLLGRNATAAEITTYKKALVSGQTLAQVRSTLAHSTEAGDAIKEIQVAAKNFQATFSSAGNVLDSLMPKTQDQWIGLAATIAMMVPPPGEAVAATEILVVGGEELLAAGLEAELDTATIYSATNVSVSNLTAHASATFDELATLDPKATGATLQLDSKTTATQVANTRHQKGNLNFSGGNEAAVLSFFRKLTGYTGNLDNAKVATFGNGGVVYSIETPRGAVSLRNVSRSGEDWTIQFKPELSNGIEKVKFEFKG